MSVNSITFKTKFGYIFAKEYNGKIYSVNFNTGKNKYPSKILFELKSKIIKFFLKKSNAIKIPCKIDGSYIQKKVWKEISKIKYGKTLTYGKIAKKLKLSPRLVGKICGQNKLILVVPCHRVIRSDGGLGGFSCKGGIKLKKSLLDFEKI